MEVAPAATLRLPVSASRCHARPRPGPAATLPGPGPGLHTGQWSRQAAIPGAGPWPGVTMAFLVSHGDNYSRGRSRGRRRRSGPTSMVKQLFVFCLVLFTERTVCFYRSVHCVRAISGLTWSREKQISSRFSARTGRVFVGMIDRGDFRDGYGDLSSRESPQEFASDQLSSTLMRYVHTGCMNQKGDTRLTICFWSLMQN